MTEVLRTAPAVDHPCALYAHRTSPFPIRTQAHHIFPIYLQKRVWGEVRDRTTIWVCGLCHDSIHAWLSYLMEETRHPGREPGYPIRRAASTAIARYERALIGG